MKTILYATNRTEKSVPALRYAYDLSKRLGAELVVLYVHQKPPIRLSMARLSDQMELQVIQEQKEILKAYCAKHLKEKYNHSRMRIEVVSNDSVLDGIIEKSKQISPDLALIGRKAKYSERGLLVGDIAHALLKKSTFPILIIPRDLSGAPIQTMLYATDVGAESISAIKSLVPMARSVNAKIHIVHIANETRNSRKDQIKWFKETLKKQLDYDHIEFKVILSDHIEEELKIYSQHIKADILALAYREEKWFFQKLYNKCLFKKLDTRIGIPLMGINPAI